MILGWDHQWELVVNSGDWWGVAMTLFIGFFTVVQLCFNRLAYLDLAQISHSRTELG